MKEVEGKGAFITGGASGIGLGMARAFARAGMKVAIADLRSEALESATAALAAQGLVVEPVQLDVTDRKAYEAAAEQVEARLGPISLLCNNAGLGITGPIKEATYDDWDWLTSVMLGGVVNGVQTFLPRMRARRSGHIVNTASMAGVFRCGNSGIYQTLKYAVVGMAEALRAELAEDGMSASAFIAGPTRTNIYWSHELRPADSDTGYAEIDKNRESFGDQLRSGEINAPFFSFDPDLVGERVLNGIMNDDLFIFSHGMFGEGIKERHDAIMRAIPETPLSDADRALLEPFCHNDMYIDQRDVPPYPADLTRGT